MQIEKNELSKVLRSVSTFDVTGCPYVAVQFTGEKPRFYRSSSFGFIQSHDFGLGSLAYVSLSHLQECLKVSEEKLEMDIDNNGILRLNSTDNVYHNQLHVHTVSANQAGLKHHEIGDAARMRLDATVFSGVDFRAFHSAAPPYLGGGKLTLVTLAGVVMWDTPDALKTVQLSPRESLLRFISGSMVDDLVISEKGYWGAVKEGLVCYIAGHTMGQLLFNEYNIPGVEKTRFHAPRFVQAMNHAATLAAENDKVELDPKHGVVCRDRFGNESIFSLGAAGWDKFFILGKTAKLIVDALSQTKEDEVVLSVANPGLHPIMKFKRGAFEVDFRL